MRILHLLNHTQGLNGHVHMAVDLACAQAAHGHTVAIASEGGDFDALLARNKVEPLFASHQRQPARFPSQLLRLRKLVREWNADIVHAHMMTSAVLAWPVCMSLRIPLVTTVHNEFEKSSILMGLGTRVIAVSGAVRDSMIKRGVSKSRISVVLNGTIGSARVEGSDRTAKPLRSPSIIFVGGMHPRKGLPDLLAAFDIIHARFPETQLHLIGGGPLLETYAAQARQLSSAAAITIYGPLDNPFQYLAGADIFVLPSHADPAPLVISEAREAGCAVVASKVDGIPELLEHGKAGLLVPPADPQALAAALQTLVESSDRLREWKQNSQINIDYLRIDRVARETFSVYQNARRRVISQPAPGAA